MRASIVGAPPEYARNEICPASAAPGIRRQVAGAAVVDAHQVAPRALRVRQQRAVEQHHRNARFLQRETIVRFVSRASAPRSRGAKKTPATWLAMNCSHSPSACSSAAPPRRRCVPTTIRAGWRWERRQCPGKWARKFRWFRGPVSTGRTTGCRRKRGRAPRRFPTGHPLHQPALAQLPQRPSTVIREVPNRPPGRLRWGISGPARTSREDLVRQSFEHLAVFGNVRQSLDFRAVHADITALTCYSN